MPLILFVVVPMAELLLLFEVAERIGGFTTLMLVITTAMVGVTILKRQGLGTLRRADLRMQQGQLPAQEIVEGILLAVAGAMLLTPGLITDVAGFTLLAPPSRRAIARRILRSGTTRFSSSFTFRGGFGPGSGAGPRDPFRDDDGRTVDGEYRREDDPDDRLGR